MSAAPSLVELARQRRALEQRKGTLPRVLFVDDEERILRAQQALFRMVYDVTLANSGAQALELLRQSHYHLIVSDQRMPGMTGIEVLRHARDISPTTVRILLTGFADLAAIVGSVNESEVYRYLSKPWNNEELQKTVAEAVRIGLELQADKQVEQKAATPREPSPATRPHAHSDAPAAQLAPVSVTGGAAESLPANACVLFLEKGQHTYTHFQRELDSLDGLKVLSVETIDEALTTMQAQTVLMMVVAIDGENRENIDFLYLLKDKHPHIVAITISDEADAEKVVSLINSARVLRVMFRPVGMTTLQLYMQSGLRRVTGFMRNPNRLRTERAVRPAAVTTQQQNQGLMQKLQAIKKLLFTISR